MLQQHVRRALAMRSLLLMLLSTALFSFSKKVGVDSFTIHLNDKLLLQAFVTAEAGIQDIALNPADADNVMKVRYSHCGKIGTERRLAIHDSERNVLKTWLFPDNGSNAMTVAGNELLPFSKRSGMQLVYYSVEIPKGKVLAGISLSSGVKASLD